MNARRPPDFVPDPFQQAAIEIDGRDLVVAAGAGTGKTSVLVRRILRRLRQDPARGVERLLVVTFTTKAASEMRGRIYSEVARDPTLRSLLPALPRAWVSTLHAFCARLLRESFVEAEVDPGFRILDETAGDEAWDDSLRLVFHRWYGLETEDGETFRRLVDMAGYDSGGERLREIVRKLLTYARATEDPEGYLQRLLAEPPEDVTRLPWWDAFVDHAWREWQAAMALATEIASVLPDSDKPKSYPAAARFFLSVRREDFATPEAQQKFFAKIRAAGLADHDVSDKKRGLWFDPGSLPRGAKGASPWVDRAAEALKDMLRSGSRSFWFRALPLRTSALVEETRQEQRSIAVLVAVARETQKGYQRFKDRQGFLDYSDLELCALRFLESEAGAAWRSRFDEVLVDEFQDVNRLQERILAQLTRPGASFRVGDVKQSIYEFRLADPSVFLARARAGIALLDPASPPPGEGSLVIPLRRNHRCAPPILSLVNRIFERLFDAETIGSAYTQQRLEPADPEQKAPEVELHLVEQRSDATPPDLEPLSPARREAIAIGRRLLEWRRGDASTEDRSWRRVGILVRSSAAMSDLRESLEAQGIPVGLASGRGLLDESGPRDFHALLSVIDNPRDDVALAAVLRSPLVRLGDSDLLRIRLARPKAQTFLDATIGAAFVDAAALAAGPLLPPSADEEGDSPEARLLHWAGEVDADAPALGVAPGKRLRAFLEQLIGWRRREQEIELGRFLEERIEETQFERLLLAQSGGVRQRALLQRMVQLARVYEGERGPSLRGFLARLRSMEERGTTKSLTSATDVSDAVTLLTMHGAKGLEFDVVVLPRLAWTFQGGRGLEAHFRVGRDWIGLPAFDPQRWSRRDTFARRTLAWQQERSGRREEARILYVALTRAKQRLWLFAEAKEPPWDAGDEPQALRAHRAAAARCALPWIMGAVSWNRSDASDASDLSPDIRQASGLPLQGHWHSLASLSSAAPPGAAPLPASPLTESRPKTTLSHALQEVLSARLSRRSVASSLLALPDLRGKYWVTEFKREGDELPEVRADRLDGAMPWLPSERDSSVERRLRGVRYHEALARLDLTLSAPSIADQLGRFKQEPWWGGAPSVERLERGIVAFFETPLGHDLRAAAAARSLEREAPFSLRWPLRRLLAERADLAAHWSAHPDAGSPEAERLLDEEWALIQGRIDCLFPTADGWIVIDWKTDDIAPAAAPARAERYRSQMQLYREAVESLWRGKVRSCLVFVGSGEVVES